MNRISTAIIAVALTFALQLNTSGASSTPFATLHQRLCQLNDGWSDLTPDFSLLTSDASTSSEIGLIQAHLRLVINHLEKADISHLTASQQQRRFDHIQTLREYMLAGEFPQNVFTDSLRPVFIDPWGTHCAVGHLIATSGHPELAAAINLEHRLDFLPAIKTAGLPEWQTASGLSLEELELIQPQYHSKELAYPKEIEELILGDSTAIIAALQADASLATAYCGGKTLIHYAAAVGDLALIKLLVEKGADLNAVSKSGTEQTKPSNPKPHNNNPFAGPRSSSTLYQVRWNEPTKVAPAKPGHMRIGNFGKVFSTPKGAAVTLILADLYGGVSGKDAMYFATKRLPNPNLKELIQNRAEVEKWLKEKLASQG